MAIDVGIENEYGATFNYHKLKEIRIINDDRIGIQVVMDVYSWINKQARIDGKQPTVRRCIIDNADFAMTPFYALLKAKFNDFANGFDDYNNDFKPERKGDVIFTEQTYNGDLISRNKEEHDTGDTPEMEA